MPTVDNKIVQMTFKNEQFERGVKESLHSLQELKKALDLDKSAQSLQNLEQIASSFDISGIAKGIDDIANRFTLVGNLGQEAFRRISSFALDEVHKITSAITSMPQVGMGKYEQKNKSVQTIQSALPEKSIEEIEAVLGKLNEYTDLTSYDFSVMANSIGKFVSAGVDLEVAERVMEGIANETASAGGEVSQANIAMYNFSQALASGSVKLMDWRSIMNQNLDTKEFKEEIIKTAIELGTLGKVSDNVGYYIKGTGKKAHQVMVDFKSFQDTLSDGWFTSDVMIKVFEEYANRESEVGKKGFEAAKIAITFTQAMDAVKDAISTGWMTSFGYLFGNLEEAGDLFTRISDAIIGFAEQIYITRNEILKGWHDGGKDGISGYQKVIEGLSNTWAVFNGIVEATKAAFKNVFGILDSSGLIEASKAFADYTAKVKEFFGVWTETKTTVTEVKKAVSTMPDFAGKLTKGMRDSKANKEIEEIQKRLLGLKDPLIKLDKYGADGIFGPETEAAVKAFQKSVGLKETGIIDEKTYEALKKKDPFKQISIETKEDTEEIEHMGKGVALLTDIFKGLFSIAKVGIGVIGLGLQIAGKVISLVTPVAYGVLNIASAIGNVISYVIELASAMLSGEDALGAFNTVLTPISNALQNVGTFLSDVASTINRIIGYLRSGISLEDIRKNFEFNTSNPTIKKYGQIIIDTFEKIQNVGKAVKPVFDTLISTISTIFSTIGQWLSGKIMDGMTAVSTFFTDLFANVDVASILTDALNGLGTALQIILGIVGGVGYGIFTLGKAAIDSGIALFDFIKNSEFVQNTLKKLSEFFQPVKDFFSSVRESIVSLAGKISNFKSFGEAWTEFISAMKNNPIGKKFIPVLQKAMGLITNFSNKIKNFTGSIRKVFELLKQFKDPKTALKFLDMTRNNDKTIKTVLTFLSNALDFLQKIKGLSSGIFNKIGPQVKGFAKTVKNALKNFFGGNGKSVGENLGEGIEGIKEGIGGAFTNLKTWFDNLVKNSPFLTSLAQFGKTVKEAIVNFFSVDTSNIADLPGKILERLQAFNPVIDWIKGKFGEIKDFIMDPNKLLSHLVGALKGIGEFVIGIFKNVDLSTIWDTAKTALGTYIMLTFAKSLKNFSESFGILTGSIDKDDKAGFSEKLRSIAISIAIFTAAIAALALIDAGQALAGVGVMTALIGVVVGALFVIGKWVPKIKELGKGMDGLGSAALNMALSIVAVIGAVALAAFVINTAGDLTKPLLFVGGIMVALGVAAWAMGKFSKDNKGATKGTAKTILAISAGVYLVVKAIGNMAGILKANIKDEGPVWKGLAMVAGIMTVLGAIAVLMARFGKGGKKDSDASTGIAPTILAISTTLSQVVSAVGKMAELMKKYPNDIGWAYGMVEGILITMGAIAVLLQVFSKDMDWKMSAVSALPIVAMGFFLDKIANTMAEGIKKISGVNPTIIEQFLIGVGEAVMALVGTVAIFSAIGLHGIVDAAIGIVVLMTAIGAGIDIAATFVSDAIDKMSQAIWLVGTRLRDFSNFVADVDETKIESVMNLLINTIIPSIATFVTNVATIQNGSDAALDLWYFGVALMLFQDSISGITEDTGKAIKQLPVDIKDTVDAINAIEGIDVAMNVLDNLGGALGTYYGNLASIMDTANKGDQMHDENGNFDIIKANQAFNDIAQLTIDDEVVAKIRSYATGGEKDLNSFAHGIQNIGIALKNYGNSISTIDSGKVTTANQIVDKVKDIDNYLNPIGDVNFNVLNGKRRTIAGFGRDVAALGQALGKYADSISGLNPGKILMANVVIDAVSTLANKLPTTGGLWQMLTGEKSLGEFAVNMSDLGTGMSEYANKVSNADFTNVDASTAAVKGLAEAQSILQSYGGLKSMIEGTAGLDKLGTNLVGLGKSLAEFATAEDGIKTLKDADFSQIMKAIEPIKGLAEAQSIMQRVGGWDEALMGKVNWSTLTQGLDSTLIQNLNEFNAAAKEFDTNDEKLLNVINLLERLAFIQTISQASQFGYKDLTEGFDGLMTFISHSLGADGNGTMISNIQQNLSNLFSAIGSDESLANINASMDPVTSAIQTAIQDNVVTPASTWGSDLVTNFATGMEGNAARAEQAANTIANIIRQYLHFSTPDKGPLADADTYGGDFISTFVKGITGSTNTVENAVVGIADMTKNGLLERIKELFNNDFSEPVITPVVDLTNVDNAASQIGTTLRGSSVSVSANLATDVAALRQASEVQNAPEDNSFRIVDSIREMGDRITDLANQMAEQMGNLKVVMDSGALVGQIDRKIDQRLGEMAKYNGRRM